MGFAEARCRAGSCPFSTTAGEMKHRLHGASEKVRETKGSFYRGAKDSLQVEEKEKVMGRLVMS